MLHITKKLHGSKVVVTPLTLTWHFLINTFLGGLDHCTGFINEETYQLVQLFSILGTWDMHGLYV